MSIAKRFQERLKQNNPLLMGIINLSTDSFCSQGRFPQTQAALAYALQLWQDGADILDLGAEPSNPLHNQTKSAAEQIDLLLPLIQALKQETDAFISIDTSHPEVIRAVHAQGAHIINDVRALRYEGAMEAFCQTDLLICLMHLKYIQPESKPEILEANPNILAEVLNFLNERIDLCLANDIARDRMIIDPGLGGGIFGKSCEDNLELLTQLEKFKHFNLPILIGASRKQFIGEILQCEESDRLIGSVITHLFAAQRGANILRVHDVKATKQTLKMNKALSSPLPHAQRGGEGRVRGNKTQSRKRLSSQEELK